MSFFNILSANSDTGNFVGFDPAAKPNPQPLRLNQAPVTFSSTEPISGPRLAQLSADPYRYTVVRNGTVYVTNDATENQEWGLTPAIGGQGAYVITVLGTPQAWTAGSPGGPITLTNLNGQRNQQFLIQIVNGPNE